MRVTLKAINDELAKRGASARLAKAAGYFYFQFGEATEWLDRTVQAPTVNALTLEQWVQEYERLKKVNQEILHGAKARKPAGAKKRASKSET